MAAIALGILALVAAAALVVPAAAYIGSGSHANACATNHDSPDDGPGGTDDGGGAGQNDSVEQPSSDGPDATGSSGCGDASS